MANRSRQLRLPATDDAGNNRLAEINAILVITTGLGIECGRFGAVVVLQSVCEVTSGIMDVDILAGRNDGCRAPALGREGVVRATAMRFGGNIDRPISSFD
jgi:hypothetical protein